MNQREFATSIVRKLSRDGFIAYWAGGCVRDILLGLDPSDFDVATNATPEQIRQLFGYGRTRMVGAAFGIIMVLSRDRRMQIEVATFRTDACYSDGRRPDGVTFSSPEEDAQRRDFTINGMFYDPLAEQVIDYVGGREDLKRRWIRAIGNPADRIREDKLRMLRAVRLAARLEFQIEPETYHALCKHSSEVASLSGERIAIELRKTLDSRAVAWAVAVWADTGLLRVLLPEVAEGWNSENRGRRIAHMLEHAQGISWLGRLSAILWVTAEDRCQGTIRYLRERLRFSKDQLSALEFALTQQHELSQCPRLPWSRIQPSLIHPNIETALELLKLRSRVGEVATSTISWLQERLAWPENQLNPPQLLTGDDLIEIGYRPNPKFREWLQQIRCLQLDGEISDKQAALDYLRLRENG